MNDPDPASADAEAESKTVADANEDSKKANLDSMPLPAPADAEDQSKQDDNVILGLTSAVSSGLAITTAAQEEPDLDTDSNSSMSTTGERPPQMVYQVGSSIYKVQPISRHLRLRGRSGRIATSGSHSRTVTMSGPSACTKAIGVEDANSGG